MLNRAGSRAARALPVTALPDNAARDPERTIAELQRQLGERTAERDEALEQQAATAEVLQAINSARGDLAPVFDAIVEKATRLCGASSGALYIRDGDLVRAAAMREAPAPLADFVSREPVRLTDMLGRGSLPPPFLHVADMSVGEAYRRRVPIAVACVELGGIRTLLAVPLLKDGYVVGVFIIYRQEVRPFTDRQIALLQTFAAQAALAIENARLLNETQAALARQTATSEILRVISRSPTNVQPVFDAIVLTAVRLLRCDMSFVMLCDPTAFWVAAAATPEGLFDDLTLIKQPIDPSANFPSRTIVEKRALYLPDWSLIDLPEHERHIHETVGVNSALYLPLLRAGECIGLLTLGGKQANAFGASEIALAESFRDQALIAIENARLFNETEEALAQQTATAEVLQVINSSPGELAPVFEAMLEKAMRLCNAAFGAMLKYDGEYFHTIASRDLPAALAGYMTTPLPVYPGAAFDLLVRGETIVHAADVRDSEGYRSGSPASRALGDLGHARTALWIALRKDSALLGVFVMYRQEIRPYNEKQIALAQSFAAQAVIAMENARLFGELRQRTADLQEALRYQTATSDVLKVISRSTFDLQPVLETLVETAVQLCESDSAMISSREGEAFRVRATFSFSPEFAAFMRGRLLPAGRGSVSGRAGLEGRVVHVHDVTLDPDYALPETLTLDRARTLLGVPLVREGVVVGVIALARNRVQPFSERQIELVRSFADQAVIAMENARLLDEIRSARDTAEAALERQTATADILKVIAGSPADTRPVFDAIAASANRLLGGLSTAVWRFEGEQGYLAAFTPTNAEADAALQALSPLPIAELDVFVQLSEGQIAQIADTEAGPPRLRDIARLRGYRGMLFVPLMAQGAPIGFVSVTRREAGGFNPDDVQLLQTFADQGVIAIQNARLFNELTRRTGELEESLEQQTATAEILRAISQSPTDVQPVLDVVEIGRAHV